MSYGNQKLSETKVFKDPVHRYIHVEDKVIWDLIGTKEFQRLRRIKQLGTTYFTFHGAEHSRFGHSLGVYEIIKRMIDDVFAVKQEWNEDNRLLCLCAALLHDVGHGPFSHAFENVFDVNHEEFGQRIILGETEINKVLRKVSPHFPQDVANIIGKTSENKLVISMISSQIDADRMDYLLRDAYFTGVSYGNFDLERLLRVMRPKDNQVVIKHSGMHAVEHYIMSRYQMYWQIYFHPVSRSAEVILTKALDRAKVLYQEKYCFKQDPIHFHSLFEGEITLQDYIKLDENMMMYYLQIWQEEEDDVLRDLCSRFVNRRFFQYVDVSADLHEKRQELVRLFKEAGIDPEYYLVADSTSDLSYDLYREGKKDGRVPIMLLMPSGNLCELSSESEIVEAITGKKRTDEKLYYPEDIIYNNETNSEIKAQIIAILEGK